MKFKVYNEEPKEKLEKEVYLRLIQRVDGGISLVACDNNGIIVSSGYLMEFDEKGTIHLSAGVNNTLGFQLDIHNRLVVEK